MLHCFDYKLYDVFWALSAVLGKLLLEVIYYILLVTSAKSNALQLLITLKQK